VISWSFSDISGTVMFHPREIKLGAGEIALTPAQAAVYEPTLRELRAAAEARRKVTVYWDDRTNVVSTFIVRPLHAFLHSGQVAADVPRPGLILTMCNLHGTVLLKSYAPRLALDAIKQSFGTEAGENSINLFVEHHLAELPQSYWQQHLGTDTPEPSAVIGLLRFSSSWGDDEIEYFDFTLPDEVTDYVVSVHFDSAGSNWRICTRRKRVFSLLGSSNHCALRARSVAIILSCVKGSSGRATVRSP